MKSFWRMILCLVLNSTYAHAVESESAIDDAVTRKSKAEFTYSDRNIGRIHEQERIQRDQDKRIAAEAGPIAKEYLRFKNWLAQYGITGQIAPTLLSQWATPNGGTGAFQWAFQPWLNWNAFETQEVGQGSIQFSYAYNGYASQQSGVSLTNRIKAVTLINDTPTNNYALHQLTYTHVLPGKLVQFGVGQYPFSNFDHNQYASNQQTNFINYALSQNASQSYVSNSLGAYVQINPTATISVAAGFQDASNISGHRIQFSSFGQGYYSWFGYAQWKPVINGLGSAQYSVLYYQQPAIPALIGASQGWSLNMVQNLNQQWGVFLRANSATGNISQISASIAGGVILNNPFGGSYGDQWGLGAAWNKTNKAYYPYQFTRDGEFVAETYLNIIATKMIQWGPSVQIILNPALNPHSGAAGVFTLRATGLF